jgi:DNA-directed RNA polymerase specialized sigma24 family protein
MELIKLRLEVLKQKKEALRSIAEPKSLVTDKLQVSPGTLEHDRKMITYLSLSEPIDKEIETKQKEYDFLNGKLISMEKALREAKGVEYQIFVMRHVDGLSVRQIARKFHYHRDNIYKILRKIEKELHL